MYHRRLLQQPPHIHRPRRRRRVPRRRVVLRTRRLTLTVTAGGSVSSSNSSGRIEGSAKRRRKGASYPRRQLQRKPPRLPTLSPPPRSGQSGRWCGRRMSTSAARYSSFSPSTAQSTFCDYTHSRGSFPGVTLSASTFALSLWASSDPYTSSSTPTMLRAPFLGSLHTYFWTLGTLPSPRASRFCSWPCLGPRRSSWFRLPFKRRARLQSSASPTLQSPWPSTSRSVWHQA